MLVPLILWEWKQGRTSRRVGWWMDGGTQIEECIELGWELALPRTPSLADEGFGAGRTP